MSPPWLPLFMPSKTVIHIACGLFSAVRVHIQSSGLYLVSWLHTCLPNQVELQWISHGVSHMTNNTILFLFNFPQERGEYTHKTSIQPVSWDWSLLFCPLCTVVRLLVTSSKTPVSYGISSTITPFFCAWEDSSLFWRSFYIVFLFDMLLSCIWGRISNNVVKS